MYLQLNDIDKKGQGIEKMNQILNLNFLLKKIPVVTIALSLLVTAIPSNPTCDLGTNSETGNNLYLVETFEEDGKTYEKYSDGTTTTYDEDGNVVVIIPTSSAFVPEDQAELLNPTQEGIQPRGFFTICIAIFKWAGAILTACEIVEWVTNGFNPCYVARQYIGKSGLTTSGNRYRVQANYVTGKIPGCSPPNSLPCNSGYYQYRFVNLGR